MVAMTHTYTRTFNVIEPANPYLRCLRCGARVEYWLDGEHREPNHPCNHIAGYESTCPSWGPVDGCQCEEHLGYVPHSVPTLPTTDHGRAQGPL